MRNNLLVFSDVGCQGSGHEQGSCFEMTDISQFTRLPVR